MNLCLVNHSDVPRAEVFTLGRHLAKRGHRVTVIYPSDGKQILTDEIIDVVSFPARFIPKIHYALPDFRKQYHLLQDLVADKGCDVIQSCDYDYLTSIPPIHIKKKLGVRWFSQQMHFPAFPGALEINLLIPWRGSIHGRSEDGSSMHMTDLFF